MGNIIAGMKMTKKFLVSFGFLCCMAVMLVFTCSFIAKKEIKISENPPFPQTGSITVYKYKLAQKILIGELQWTAITEKDSNDKWGEFCRVSLRVHNTTDEYIDTFFTFNGSSGSINVKLRPGEDFETTEICSASVTGVVPATKELTIR